jgi:hypothetical protein
MAAPDDDDALCGVLTTGGSAARRDGLERLARRPDPLPTAYLEAMLACLGDETKSVQRLAAETVARLVDRAAVRAALVALVDAEDPQSRWGAAYALGRMGEAVAGLAPLLEALDHRDSDRRWAAAKLLVAAASAPVVRDRLCALAENGPARQRRMSLYCLRGAEIATPGVDAIVLRRFGDDDAGVRLAALAWVGVRPIAPSVIDGVIRVLGEDGDFGVRRAAAAALARCGEEPRARAALVAAAASPDPALRRAAAGVTGSPQLSRSAHPRATSARRSDESE